MSRRFSIRIRRSELDSMLSILSAYPVMDIRRFQRQVHFIFNRYMSTMEQIAVTTLDIVNDRVFPYYARSYSQWNNPDHVEVSGRSNCCPEHSVHSIFFTYPLH